MLTLIFGLLLLLLLSFFKLYTRAALVQRTLPSASLTGICSTYWTSILNCFRSKTAVQEANAKANSQLFTFPLLGQWAVLASSKTHVRDFYNAPEQVLSMESAAEELLQLRYIVGPLFNDELYHIPVIRAQLNTNLADVFPLLKEEIRRSCASVLDTQISGPTWTTIIAWPTFSQIICQATSRVLVGEDLCCNEQYRTLVMAFANDVLSAGPVLKFLVPQSLRGFAGMTYRRIYGHHRRMTKLLRPVIELRREQQRLHPELPLPNDMLSWLMESEVKGEEHSAESLSMRMLNVNFVALHTTTKTFIHALYHLAAQPRYIALLRSEFERNLDSDVRAWTKESLSRCVKLDSFFKETLRLNGVGAIWMPRLTLADFEFSDGTRIPAGHYVATAAAAIHQNDINYDKAAEFDGNRFASIRTKSGDDGEFHQPMSETDWQHRMTGNSETYLAFGGGRHLCPGRFFASMEMKCLMAQIILKYDLKLPPNTARPADEWFGPTSKPATKGKVLFQRCVV